MDLPRVKYHDLLLLLCFNLFFLLIALFIFLRVVVIILKRIVGNVVQQQGWLVWILQDEILAIGQLHTSVNDAPKNAPAIVQIQIGLISKLLGLECLRSQNDVLGRIAEMISRNITE